MSSEILSALLDFYSNIRKHVPDKFWSPNPFERVRCYLTDRNPTLFLTSDPTLITTTKLDLGQLRRPTPSHLPPLHSETSILRTNPPRSFKWDQLLLTQVPIPPKQPTRVYNQDHRPADQRSVLAIDYTKYSRDLHDTMENLLSRCR